MSLISEALTRWLPVHGRVRNNPAPGGRLPGGESPGANKKGTSTGPLIAYQNLGQPVWAPRDYAAFAREGFMQNAIVYRSVRMIAEAAASIPLLLYEGANEIEDHPLLDLIRRPSLDHTGTDFLEAWYGFLLVAGNAYVEAVALDGEIRELHVLRPDRMKVIPGLDGWPEGYEYTVSGRSVRFIDDVAPRVRPILHVRLFHPANDHYGMSPIEAAASAIDIHNTASAWNKALLDNSARPSGALVYAAANGQMTEEQFTRLKSELETNFQGARAAGRPLLLEGGLDWKPLSLSPKDMDFIEAKNAAAREIALAIGVPPMLLGIPGDNTYANYQEAQRAFWRQTVLPLVNRTARALSSWLTPAFATGSLFVPDDSAARSRPRGTGVMLELRPDLDQIEALSSERDALWRRLEGVSFLTGDEKRAAAGYGVKPESERALKYNPDQPRVPAGNGDISGEWTNGSGGGGRTDDGRVRVAQARGGRGRSPISGRFPEATPAQQTRLDQSELLAQRAIQRVRKLEPNWRPQEQAYETIEGQISANAAMARQAEARLSELSRVPNTNPEWGLNRLRKELNGKGFRFSKPTDAEGYLYRNDSNAEVRIMRRPENRYRDDPLQKHENEYYYRYKPSPGKGWGQHITIPDKPLIKKDLEEIFDE
ncbi:phage portal protein [Hyphomicrobium sp.]|uniref:phage portal protein n=1 Tax=Hyphomicrobium sp. TaxID=82 RepID=UPI002D79048C|nr:phage portal protein [Hyphomicrobium sp.]HET6390781.1 phage portal protein [Hyphomicrobium sp.]